MNHVEEIMALAKANTDLWPGQVAVFEISPKSEIIEHGALDMPSFWTHWHRQLGEPTIIGSKLPDDWQYKKFVGILHGGDFDGGMALYEIPPRVAEHTADDEGNDDE